MSANVYLIFFFFKTGYTWVTGVAVPAVYTHLLLTLKANCTPWATGHSLHVTCQATAQVGLHQEELQASSWFYTTCYFFFTISRIPELSPWRPGCCSRTVFIAPVTSSSSLLVFGSQDKRLWWWRAYIYLSHNLICSARRGLRVILIAFDFYIVCFCLSLFQLVRGHFEEAIWTLRHGFLNRTHPRRATCVKGEVWAFREMKCRIIWGSRWGGWDRPASRERGTLVQTCAVGFHLPNRTDCQLTVTQKLFLLLLLF